MKKSMRTTLFFILIAVLLLISCGSPSIGAYCYSPAIWASKYNKTYVCQYDLIGIYGDIPVPKPDSIILEHQFYCSKKIEPRIIANEYQLLCYRKTLKYDFVDSIDWYVINLKPSYLQYKKNCYKVMFDSLPNDTIELEFIYRDSTVHTVNKIVFAKRKE